MCINLLIFIGHTSTALSASMFHPFNHFLEYQDLDMDGSCINI